MATTLMTSDLSPAWPCPRSGTPAPILPIGTGAEAVHRVATESPRHNSFASTKGSTSVIKQIALSPNHGLEPIAQKQMAFRSFDTDQPTP